MSITIRSAREDDVGHLLAVSAEHELKTKTPERIRAEGFLVSAYPAPFYIRNLKHISIAEIEGEFAGFTLTFPSAETPPEVEPDVERIRTVIGDEDYFIIKQVATVVKFQKHGVGRAMYERHLSGLNVRAFAPIVLLPPKRNLVSIAFHERMGFRQAESIPDEHGNERSGLWCWRPAEG
jgi:GNAT superfamily N-acetyltransferase